MILQINFESKQQSDQSRPPHDGNHTACGTPNPPPWCNDAPDANIDMGIGFLIGMGLIIGITTKYYEKWQIKKHQTTRKPFFSK